MQDISIEKTDGRIVKIQSCGFQSFLFFRKQKNPDILTGKFFGILILIFQKIRDIVFIAVDGTFFKVTDFPASSSCSKYFSYIIKSSI